MFPQTVAVCPYRAGTAYAIRSFSGELSSQVLSSSQVVFTILIGKDGPVVRAIFHVSRARKRVLAIHKLANVSVRRVGLVIDALLHANRAIMGLANTMGVAFAMEHDDFVITLTRYA